MAFSLEKIQRRAAELARLRIRAAQPIPPLTAQRRFIGETEAPATTTLALGDHWGERDAIYDLSGSVAIPAEWQGQTLALQLDLSMASSDWSFASVEGLLFLDGQALHALDHAHREVLLDPTRTRRDALDFTIHLWTGLVAATNHVTCMELRLLDPPTDRLQRYLVEYADVYQCLAEHDPARFALAAALESACAVIDYRAPQSDDFYASCAAAVADFERRLAALALPPPPRQPRITAVGHAHIDVAWLWQLRHTRMKTANTFATALYHMERYPHFTFMHSTPQVYQWVKEDHPAIYARIKERAREGRWEVEGGMWVEADTNITGGESLIRQFVHGLRFFREEFGYGCQVLWLPDVFGYSAALPQIIRGCGLTSFVTTKISWNDTNRFPHDTFWWEGLDGSRVLTHFITAANNESDRFFTYNAELTARMAALTWRNYREKAINTELLVAYGYGDGGGGPTRAFVEAAGDLAVALTPSLPTVATGRVADFMQRLAERLADQPVPVWNGELYFEYHRGTYTSQARTKRNNRQTERLLHQAEFLAALAHHLGNQPYPTAALDAAWKLTLTHQFHDILPGSSIAPVYADATRHYADLAATLTTIIAMCGANMTDTLAVPAGALVAWNTTAWPQTALVAIAAAQADTLGGITQLLADGTALARVDDIPPYGATVVQPTAAATSLTVTPTLLENDFLRVELNERGEMSRLFDKEAGREVLAAGDRANVFQCFEDKPNNFDAWDIDAFYTQKQWEFAGLPTIAVAERGPLRASIAVTWNYAGRTTLTQHITLMAHSRRIDFVTHVDWHERQTLLKVAFPVNIHSGRATAEVQFGVIERPTHRNTSWDEARFETCAQTWIELSEGDYGVAVLNDCKYGYDIHERTLRQTLLKSAISPDAHADEGEHEFTYSLWPHAGDWFSGGVPGAAADLNAPPLLFTAVGNGAAPAPQSFFSVDAAHVVIATVKQAEAEDAIVVRVYETANRRGDFTLRLPFAASRAVTTNLVEEEAQPADLAAGGRSIQATITPFAIKTFLIWP